MLNNVSQGLLEVSRMLIWVWSSEGSLFVFGRHPPLVKQNQVTGKPWRVLSHQSLLHTNKSSTYLKLCKPDTSSSFKAARDFSYLPDTVQDHITAEMSEAPPQLGEIPQQSEMSVPTLSSTMDNNTTANGGTSVQKAKDSIYNSQVSSMQPIDRLIQY